VISWQFNSINIASYVKRQSLLTRGSAQIDVKPFSKKEERKPEEPNGYSMGLLPSLLAGS
jgi:hypothetical protein